MADRPKSPSAEPHSDHAAGTFSKKSKASSHQAGDAASAKHENRFAEVQRKSREARDRIHAASQLRAEQREVVERDRDFARGAEEEHPAPFVGAQSSVRGQRPAASPQSTVERAAALLDGDLGRQKADDAEPDEASDAEPDEDPS
jgi:hypothetical protein